MKKNRPNLFILCLCFILFQNVNAYNLKQISNRDGLSNSAILSIYQDYNGFMWFGSCDGLNLYNGLNIEVYKPTNNNLSGNLIEGIIETDKDIFWIHTNYGLNKLDKRHDHIEAYNQFKGKYFIRKDKNNTIFIINEDSSVYYYHNESKSFKRLIIEGLSYNNILNFIISQDNTIHIFTKDGQNPTYSISTKGNEISLIPNRGLQHDSNLLYCFNESDIHDIIYFIDSTYTLYEYNIVDKKKTYVYNLQKEIEKNGEISSTIKYHNDYLIAFKTNGLTKLRNTPEKAQNYETETIGIKSGIFCLLKDRNQDLIWIGTDGQGVYIYSKDTFSLKSFTPQNLIRNIDKPIRALFLDDEKTLWIGTKGDGILRIPSFESDKDPITYSPQHITTLNSNIKDNSVYTFLKSKKNILWIGTESGLNYYSYKDKSIKKIDLTIDGKPVGYIHSICELNDSTIWLATVGTGIVKATMSGTNDAPILNKAIRTIVEDGTGFHNYFFTSFKEDNSTLWFGNRGNGAYYIVPESTTLNNLKFDQQYNNRTINDVFSINKDSSGNIWFGTSFGLIKYSPSKEITVYNEKDGLPNNTVHGILIDSYDNLWLSTNNGIVRFDPQQENFHTYNYLNGLQVIEFSDGASFKAKSGELFFGGINGFVSITENKYQQQDYRPDIQFNNLMIFGEEKNIFDFIQDNTLKLNYNQNFFALSFTALDYINGNNYTYSYKLEKLSDQWIDNGTSNKASFTSLPPGKYNLLIKYKNKLTNQESPVYTLSIQITPPWYMSIWAYLSYILFGIFIIFLIIKTIRIRNRKKKQAAIEKLTQQHEKDVHESKLRFFTNIAHELCTPLTLIYGPCSRILSHHASDQFVKKYTQLIQRNAERLNDLIQELIEFRRIETGNKPLQIAKLPINEIVVNITNSFDDLAESKKIHFKKDVSEALYWNSDKEFIHTIITNLLSNAFKYTHNNGYIEIKVSEEDNKLTIIVSNTGKGIKEKDLDKIFDRYSILDDFENNEGHKDSSRNGLGLAIINSMIKLLSGTIEVNSTLNERTDFIVKIPQQEIDNNLTLEPESIIEINIKKEHEPTLELPKYEFNKLKPTVFIIDDDIEILWFISEIFTDEFNVIPIEKSRKIKDLLAEIHPDIIICDVMMPGLDGISFAKELKTNKKTAHIPMILISAQHNIEKQIEGLASGAEMYITKPFNTDYLYTSVKHLISRKETLKDYFNSPLSAFDLAGGKLTHKENTKFVQDIMDIINKNIMDKKLSALFIANELNISSRHLYRRLNEIGSISPADMIKESRLHIARNLLRNTKMTIDEVIFNSGFTNRATFFRAFSQKYGCTPKEYREKESPEL
ncbi:MAG: two-component regulator propeller domain-containing protein [Dysgonomonas sp.]|nr:two-component regulator propeller domain-containing protein [Dysgonomonas sp.]